MRNVTLDDVALHPQALAKLDEQILAGDQAHQTRALFLLSRGALREGWKEYDFRIKSAGRITYDRLPVHRWQGEGLRGKHVLVWLEQGIGDQIFAAGLLPDLLKVAGSVTLFCDSRLAPVFRRAFPEISVHQVGEPVSPRVAAWAFDCQMSIADLGLAFRPELPRAARPYLKADPARVAALRRRYAPNGERVVGVSWASGNPHRRARRYLRWWRRNGDERRRRSCGGWRTQPLVRWRWSGGFSRWNVHERCRWSRPHHRSVGVPMIFAPIWGQALTLKRT